MFGRQILPIPGIAKQVLLAVQHLEWDRGRCPLLALSYDVLRFRLGLDAVEDLANWDAGPLVAEAAPTGDAMDVRDHVFGRQRAKLFVVDCERIFNRAEHFEVPRRDVGVGHRAELQERPAVGGREGLAGWDAGRIDAFSLALALEEERHFASIGIALLGRIVPGQDVESCRAILAVPPRASGSVAQTGERLNRTQEVRGSKPLRSTICPVSGPHALS